MSDTSQTRETRELEQDIDRTRERLENTVNALEARLSPGQLLDQAIGMLREHGGAFTKNLGRSVENNPLPTLVTGAGLAWLMFSSAEPPRPATHGRGTAAPESRTRAAGEALSERVEQARDAVAGAAADAGSRIGETGEAVREEARRLGRGAGQLMEEQPLVAGGLGVALGALLGSLLPGTDQEKQVLGTAGRRIRHGAERKVAGAYAEAREKISETADAVEHNSRPTASDCNP